MKFETGKTYATRLTTDHSAIIRFKIHKRTDKTVTITGNLVNDPQNFRIYLYEGIEKIRPWGSYSMCPIISADQVLASAQG